MEDWNSGPWCTPMRLMLLLCLQWLIAPYAVGQSGQQLLWSTQAGPTNQAEEFVAILRAAAIYGLRADDYNAESLLAAQARLAAAGRSSSLDKRMEFDLAMSTAATRFVNHLHYGRINPRAAGFELPTARTDLDVQAAVTAIAHARDVATAVSVVEPRFYHYAMLKTSLAHYRTLAGDATLTALPPISHSALHAGDTYAGAPALRRLLIALDDMRPGESPSDMATTLDAALMQALGRFQQRHGLTADGALGKTTMTELTTPLAQRVRQIELTLERWRWVPDFDTPPIIVNIPQFELFAFRTTEDRVADIVEMPVIVGQAYPRTRTPVFIGDLAYVVFRPFWNVPRSITVREMLPALRAQPNYLSRNNLELVRGQSDDAPTVVPSPESIGELAAGKLRLRQRPGDDNALGLIKFVFPNSHDVYMHSTPAHNLFLQSRRAFSHGCIRVSDPVALASYALRNTDGGWSTERILDAMHANSSSRVNLVVPIRVMILYGTALATEAGPIRFFDDIYGHDRKLESLLGLEPIHGATARAGL